MSLKIAMIGYGKMGREIEKISEQRGHKLILKINSSNLDEFNEKNLEYVDVAIEFSTPGVAVINLLKLAKSKIPTVCGTTAWLKDYNKVTEEYIKNETAFLYASNFSIGVNLFFKLNEELAKMMSAYSNYDVNMKEIHHLQKLDAPSGTAVTLANQICQISEQKKSWSLDNNEKDTLFINAIREGEVKGLHRINYESEEDIISIQHEAKSRKGFALGSILAAEWIINKNGIYNMKDVLNI